ncbi:MAG: hypothetical protein K6E10_12890 [Eubacterium sp.]|nr:hypothetical protein [Eubacterium sp.]
MHIKSEIKKMICFLVVFALVVTCVYTYPFEKTNDNSKVASVSEVHAEGEGDTEASENVEIEKYGADLPDNPITITGIYNEYYAHEYLTVTPADGYLISFNIGDSVFSTSLTLSWDDIYTDDGYQYGSGFLLYNPEDKSVTVDGYYEEYYPNIVDLTFDAISPGLSGLPTVDDVETSISDGDEVVGENVSIRVYDTEIDFNNSSIIDGDTSLSIDELVSEEDDMYQYVGASFTAEEGNPKTITINIKDYAENAYSLSFTLYHPLDKRPVAEIDITDFNPIYVGTEYDLSDYIYITNEYDGDYLIHYYDGDTEIDKPSTDSQGTYSFQVECPETDAYRPMESDLMELSISYLPINSDSEEEDYLTLSGLSNGSYAKDSVSVQASEGYEIMLPEGSFAETIKLSESDIYVKDENGNTIVNPDLGISFRRSSDGALSDIMSLVELLPAVGEIIFDNTPPAISGSPLVDGIAQSISGGSVVTGNMVEITVADDNLEKVVTSDKTYTVSGTNSQKLVFETGGSSKDITFTAYDKAGNTYSFSFTLTPPEEEEVAEEEEKKPEETPEESPAEAPEQEKAKYNAALTINLSNQYYGVTYEPTIYSNSDGASQVIFQYKVKGDEDYNFSSTKPSQVGNYIVRALIPETDNYYSVSQDKEYSISYLPKPKVPYSFSGDMGKNDYYISQVNIVAASGYSIAASTNGSFAEAIPYHEGIGLVYLRRNSDGARTSSIIVGDGIKIDTDIPSIGPSVLDQNSKKISLNGAVYADIVNFSIIDDHLDKVTIDGEEIEVKDNEAKISLDADGGENTFAIKAIDEAGNEYSTTINLLASWMKDNIIPANKKVRLKSGKYYKLDSGSWTVSGDTTVYVGGGNVYVNGDGEYTFTPQ